MPRVAPATAADSTVIRGLEAKLWLAADTLRNSDRNGTISLVGSGAGSCSGAVSAPAGPTGSAVTDRRYSSHCGGGPLGRVYEYFLTRFSSAEGKNGGKIYTPPCVVRLLVEPVPVRKALAPDKGRIYDPACGSGGMFVQSEKFVESHGGTAMRDSAKLISEASPRELREAKHHRGDISIYGQESNATTRRLAIMNLAIRGIEADFGPEHADTFRNVQHPGLVLV